METEMTKELFEELDFELFLNVNDVYFWRHIITMRHMILIEAYEDGTPDVNYKYLSQVVNRLQMEYKKEGQHIAETAMRNAMGLR